jgi:hypothetical protein
VGFNVAASAGSVTVSALNGSTLLGSTTLTVPSSTTDLSAFVGTFGFGPITEVDVAPQSSLGFPVIDNLTYGTSSAVPEPSSLVLWCVAGAVGLAVARIRSKRSPRMTTEH